MRIIYHLFLGVFLFFAILGNIWFSAPLTWVENATYSEEGIKGVEHNWEKLSFDTTGNWEENIELKSAEDKDDKNKTIKELKTNIAELQSDKKHITTTFNAFILQNGNLRKFFKYDLDSTEMSWIESIITRYNSRRFKTEWLLKAKARQWEDTTIITSDLLSLKKDLYIAFLPYIDSSQLWEYKVFIKADLKNTKQDKNIQSDIYKKEKIVEEKRSIIQEKIDASDLNLEEKKYKFIESKINKRLKNYEQSPRFKSLTLHKQKFIFWKVLWKITERRIALESSENIWTKSKKIKLYKIVEWALEKFILNLK